MLLLKFREALDAEEFFKMYSQQPFDVMEPDELCQLVYVIGVTASATTVLPRPYPLLAQTEPWPIIRGDAAGALGPRPRLGSGAASAAVELPTCAVCLERMDSTVTGLVTVNCQHTYHCACLQRWPDSRCPVCRYSHTMSATGVSRQPNGAGPADSSRATCCQLCGTQSDLWVCLICASVGCGRYKEGHAQQHYQETGHLYSLELETQRVWDYPGDGYVHRLIQSQSDGKLVELPSASNIAATTPDRSWHARSDAPRSVNPTQASDASFDAGTTHELNDKLDAIGQEYSALILSQLDSQRAYYEQRMAAFRAQTVSLDDHERLCDERDALRSRCEQMEAQCAHLTSEFSKSKAEVARHATQLRRALDTAKQARQQHEEEKSVSQGLYANVQKLQEKQASQEQQIADLSEQLRDLMFFVSARDKVEQSEGDAAVSLAGGDVSVPQPSAKKHGKKGKR